MNLITRNAYPAASLVPARLFGLVDSLLGTESRPAAESWTPSADISETEGSYLVKADLPEVKIEDVKVFVRDGVLTLQGERKYEKSKEDEKVHLQERGYGSFTRRFRLPKDADSENVSADYKNGTLTVTIPKKAEVQAKEISVNVH